MKKLISLLLALMLVISLLPMTVFAAPAAPATPVKPHVHKYNIVKHNLKYHWTECSCGYKIGIDRHVDPLDTDDDICTCGMHFSDNADLTTLWVKGCEEIEDFNKNVTDYTLKTVSYKSVKEIQIRARTFNAQSTVELPEDLTLKEGTNVFPVKVTSGNRKNIKTYTLTIINESK